MKKTIIFILLIFQILMITGCSESKMNQKDNSIMSHEFSRTLNNYYYKDDGSTRISIYSYSTEISPILTLSLQNLFNKHDVLTENMKVENNSFFYSVVRSVYEKKNYIDVNQLTTNSSQYDFYLALKIADLTNDKECGETIKKMYIQYKPKVEWFSEKIYEKINLSYQGEKDNSMDTKVITSIKKYSEDIDYDFENLADLHACLNYIQFYETDISKDVLRKIFNTLSNYDNQMYILSQGDIIASQYMDSISILVHYLDNSSLNNSFFEEYLRENIICYQPISYEIVSLRNFALYITALYFDKNTVDDNLYNQLLSISEDLRSKVLKEDYASVFYYNYICKKLNLNNTIEIEENDEYKNLDIVNKYYYFKLNNDTIDHKNIKNEDILSQLMFLDICNDKNFIEEILAKNIDIYNYQDEKDFHLYLNLYVNILVNNDLLTDKEKEKIISIILSKKNIYGYSGLDKNYDFEASSYYVNILNTIEGGFESGLR